MKRFTRLFFAATMMSSLTFAANIAAAQTKTTGNTTVAIVNGHAITTKEVKLASEDLFKSLRDIPAKHRYTFLIQYLVERRLLAQQAIREGLGTNAEYKTRLVFYQAKALRDAYYIEKLRASITDEMAKAVYDREAKTITGKERFLVHHILVATKQEAETIIQKLNTGEQFEDLAKIFSLDGSKSNGGSLALFTADEMPAAFSAAAGKLGKGEFSKPVKTEYGWHIIRLDAKQSGARPFEEIKGPIKAVLLRKAIQDKIAELTKAAKIEILDPKIKKQIDDMKKQAAEAGKKGLKPKQSGKSDATAN